MFVDSSYSGLFAQMLKLKLMEGKLLLDGDKWDNTVLVASTDETSYTWHGEVTKQWSKLKPTSPLSWIYHNVSWSLYWIRGRGGSYPSF